MKPLLSAFLVAIIIGGLILASVMRFGTVQASTNVTGILCSDTTWTKANSPYNLTGPVSINSDVTLTIEPGTTVNLNNFYITVNGVLVAKGTSTDKIQINGISGAGPFGDLSVPFTYGINFTALSVGYNAQTGSGSIIENAVINSTTLALAGSETISNDIINGYISSTGSSEISNNVITGEIHVTSWSEVINNNINGTIHVQTPNPYTVVIFPNVTATILGVPSPIISGNNITDGGTAGIGSVS
jgi:hypothetical protein